MTTKQSKQMNQMQGRFLNQQILFKRGSKHQKPQHFDGQSNNLQLNHIGSQQHVLNYAAPPAQSSDRFKVTQCDPFTPSKGKWNQIAMRNNDTFLRDSVSKQKIQRTFSSKKFDVLATNEARKRTKRIMPQLFGHMMKKESTSKKSTDEQSLVPMENLKAENEQYLQKIRQQERRLKKIQREILEEKKLHELQKHMYNHSIEKLKKLAGILASSEDEEEGLDRLSIESN